MPKSLPAIIGLLFAAFSLNYIDRQMPYSMLPLLRRDLGFADWQLGLIGSVFQWVYALSMPIAGRMADLFRRDRMILASIILFSLATLGCSLSTGVVMFLFCRAIIAVTEALYHPAAAGLIAAIAPDSVRSRALGIHQSAQFLGLFLGGWYGGFMADRESWRLGFALAAFAGLAYTPVLAKVLPAPNSTARPLAPAHFTDLFRSRCYLALCAAFFCFCAMLWIFYAWYPTFLHERYHLSFADSGWNATLFVQAPCAAGVFCGGLLADRLSKRNPAARYFIAAAGILLSSPFGYLTFSATSLANARLCSAAYGALAGLMIANVFAAAFDVLSKDNYGAAAGVLNMVGGISSAAMIFLAGIWKNTIGFSGMLWWVLYACALSAVVLAFVGATYLVAERSRLSPSTSSLR